MEVTPSQYAWEREALAFVRAGLPDVEPVRAWSNFEFVADDGSINEVDLLVLTSKGFYLVEIKSRPGVIDGDAMTWRWTVEGDSRERVLDNPRLAANRKAKKLASLLQRQKAMARHRLPFLEPLVFLSAANLKIKLQGAATMGLCVRDRQPPPAPAGGREATLGIVYALTHLTPEEYNDARRRRVDRPLALVVARALEEAGIRRSQRHRRVGEYQLEKLLEEGPRYQDWQAKHVSLADTRRRVRLYPLAPAAARDKATRELLLRAARREFELLEGVEHPGISRPLQFLEHEIGPALVFDYDPGAVRLDHFLARKGAGLGIDLRLHFVRQVAEVLRHAHDQRLYHRALCPRSILVRRPDGASPTIQILNWQTGSRDGRISQGHPPRQTKDKTGTGPTTHFGELVDDASSAYLAPESQTDPSSQGEQLDVFSLGAVAFLVLTNQPPAANFLELHERLRQDYSLRLDAQLDGIPKSLARLIENSTAADLGLRLSSIDDFLRALDTVEDELTTPEPSTPVDPTQAKPNDLLAPGITVVRRLGQGSTAVVFLVRSNDRTQVLKLALDPAQNDRLNSEFEVIGKLDSSRIVKATATVPIGNRVGILLAMAGEQTLGQRLREEGPLHLDLLQRFGEDLLEAVVHLHDRGINHRDIKPDNLGVRAVGRGDAVHLTLFDFSLARAPADNIRAGTRPYLDPFLPLRKPPRWDEYAERFAAAMTLYEMATGTLPRWGDGKTDPALQSAEVSLDAELFDAAIREPLSNFFRTALRRQAKSRFGSVQEMRDAWREIFARVDQPAIPVSTTGDGDEPSRGGLSTEDVAKAQRDTPLAALGLSARAINALSRSEVLTVENLLALPVVQVTHMRGVGNKTRKEILQALTLLGERFSSTTSTTSGSTSRSTDGGDGAAEGAGGNAYSIDLLAEALASRKQNTTEARALRLLLGMTDAGDSTAILSTEAVGPLFFWPSQTEVAEQLEVTRARVGQILGKARQRWQKQVALTTLRDDLADILRARGGVMTGRELREALLAARGSAQREPLRTRWAGAVLRAAVEAELDAEAPRWIARRSGPHLLVAIDDNDGEMLADMAEQLGRRADALVAQEPLPSPTRAAQELQAQIDRMELPALPAPRLLSLAAAASSLAAVSPRLELYPRSLDPLRALKLARGALLGISELQDKDIRDRIRVRYPEMEKALPGRPELDQLLKEAGWELAWSTTANNGRGAYRSTVITFTSLTSGPTTLTRYATSQQPGEEPGPEEEELAAFDNKLQRATREGGLLILSVAPQHGERAKDELSHRFALEVYSVEESLLRHLHAFAKEKQIKWPAILKADAADRTSADWRRLQVAVAAAIERMLAEVCRGSRPLLLVRAGLLARYDRLKDVMESLRNGIEGEPGSATPPDGGAPFVWMLVPSDDLHVGPRLDGKAVPVLTPSYWRRVPDRWLKNQRPMPAPSPSSPAPQPRKRRAQ